MPATQTFSGKEYKLAESSHTKTGADEIKERFKKYGYSVRVTKEGGLYRVWTHATRNTKADPRRK